MEKKKIRYKIVEDYLDLNFPRKDTRYQYRSHLNKFFRFLDVDANTYFDESRTIKDYENDVKQYWGYLMNKHNAKSIPPQLSTIRNFLEEYDIEFKTKFWRDIARRGKGNGVVREDRIPTLSELQKILDYGDVRDRAYFMMMATSGMRENEICQIRISDVDFDSDPPMIKIPANIAKNKKRRVTFMTHEACVSVKNWLNIREKYVKTNAKKFIGLKKYLEDKYDREFNGTAEDRIFPWTPKTSRYMWNRLLEKAELTKKDQATGDYELHLYVLRKFFETKLGEIIPDKYIKAMMGHSGYMGDPYFRPEQEKIKEFYQKGMDHLLIFKSPENQEEIDSMKRKLDILTTQMKGLLEFQNRVTPKHIIEDDDGMVVEVEDVIPKETMMAAFKDEQERKKEFEHLTKTLGSKELARAVLKLKKHKK